MDQLNNSDVIKHTLFTLVRVASTKTSGDYAWSSIKRLLNELRSNYDFLKYIEIGDLESLTNTKDDINIVSHMNIVEKKELGKAIQELVDLYKKYLGHRAGYFFISEFKEHLGERYHSMIKSMGVDLRLIDLQNDIYSIDSKKYKIKEDSSANIAFVEKEE